MERGNNAAVQVFPVTRCERAQRPSLDTIAADWRNNSELAVGSAWRVPATPPGTRPALRTPVHPSELACCGATPAPVKPIGPGTADRNRVVWEEIVQDSAQRTAAYLAVATVPEHTLPTGAAE
jgi:hypothetical protein